MPKIGYDNFTQAQIDIVAYIKYYNYQREHSYNNYLYRLGYGCITFNKRLSSCTKILDHYTLSYVSIHAPAWGATA